VVYVDNYRAPYRNMKMSHLTADSEEELDKFASALGLKVEWKQKESSFIHYDVSESKRLMAIRLGAKECTPLELVRAIRENPEMRRKK